MVIERRGANIELASMFHVDTFKYVNEGWSNPYAMLFDMYCDTSRDLYYFTVVDGDIDSSETNLFEHYQARTLSQIGSCRGRSQAESELDHYFRLYVLDNRYSYRAKLDSFLSRIDEAARLVTESEYVRSGGMIPLAAGAL